MGIISLTKTKVVAATATGVRIQALDGEIQDLKADTIVLAIGSRPTDSLSKELSGIIEEVYVIGDAVTPGKITNCIRDAVELSLRI